MARKDETLNWERRQFISLGPDFSICEGGDTTLSIGSGYLSYNWSNGSTADTALLSSGHSWVVIQDLTTFSASDTIFIDSFSNNFIDLGNDSLICEDNSFNLSAGLGHSTYSWNTGAQTPEVVINTIGTYWVEVVNTNGCIDYDTISFDTLVNIFQLFYHQFLFLANLFLKLITSIQRLFQHRIISAI